MSTDPDLGAGAGHFRPGDGGDGYRVDARDAMGVQVGEGNTQIIYSYGNLTWTDGVVPPPLASVSGRVDSPYRGLYAFEERDAAFFFGREWAADQVLDQLSGCLDGTGLLVVSGVSGAGKSSLLRAGVLPRVRGAGLGAAPGAASWPCLLFTPGRAPLDALAVRVARLAGTDAAAVRRGLNADPATFALAARQAALAPSGELPGYPSHLPRGQVGYQQRLLLVVDQFEQLFTQCSDEAERQAFIIALHAAAARDSRGQVPAALVVLGMRADFEARCADYPQLADSIQDRYLLRSMTERQLRMAITEPARKAGSSVDPHLVDVLLHEVSTPQPASSPGVPGPVPVSRAGVLPLLSHALDQAWRSRSGDVLTVADYERTGGIEAAVASSAQRAYDSLTPDQQAVARQIFTRLTATSSDGTDTASRANRAELAEGRDAARARDIEAVLEAFAAERLLTLAAGTVEISHEVLLTAWPLLRDTWLAETHADRMVRTRLQNTAAEWDLDSRDPSYLYSGILLEAAADAAARIGADPGRHVPLSRTERDFLRASQRALQHRTRRRRQTVAFLLALVVGLATATVLAVRAIHGSNLQRDMAISVQLADESEALGAANATVSDEESLAAWGVYHSPQAGYAMAAAASSPQVATFLGGPGPVHSVAFSPDGKTLATGDGDGTTRLWDLATGDQIRSLTGAGSYAILSVAFSSGGKLLATGDGGGNARVWDLATGRQIRSFAINGSRGVTAVAFSPDGTTLATSSWNGGVWLWSIAGGRQPRSPLIDPHELHALAFSPDGKTLATGDNWGIVRVWDLATGQQIQSVSSGDGAPAYSVAFSPDGKLLAVGDGTARVWNPATGKQVRTLTRGAPAVNCVAFSPNGRILATGNENGSARLWDLATGQQLGSSLTGASGSITAVAFSPNGKTLATGGYDGTARLWDLATSHPLLSLPGGANSVIFSPDGKTVVTNDGITRLWNNETGQQIRSFAASPAQAGGSYAIPDAIMSVALSPDGKTLATGISNTVVLWDAGTGQQILSFPAGEKLADILELAWSPDSKLLATSDLDGTARLWNAATGHLIWTLKGGPSFSVSTVAFSPDSQVLATGSPDGTIRLWNLTKEHQLQTLIGGYGQINSIAFSPNGKVLAAGDNDGTARLFNTVSGQQVGSSLISGTGAVTSVAFSPDSGTLATDDADGTLRLWHTVTGGLIRTLSSSQSGSGSSLAFSPDGAILAAGIDGAVQLWDVGNLIDPLKRLCSQIGGRITQAEWERYVPPGPAYVNVCTLVTN